MGKHSPRRKPKAYVRHPAEDARTRVGILPETSQTATTPATAPETAQYSSAPVAPVDAIDGEETGAISSTLGIGFVLVRDMFAGMVAGAFGIFTFGMLGPHEKRSDSVPWQIGTFLIAGFSIAWIEWGVWHPTVKYGSFSKRQALRHDFAYCSSHPWYVLIDLLALPLFIWQGMVSYAKDRDGLTPSVVAGRHNLAAFTITFCAVLVLIAISRLVGWYGFNKRLDPEDCNRAWLPVAIIYGCIALLVLAIKIF